MKMGEEGGGGVSFFLELFEISDSSEGFTPL